MVGAALRLNGQKSRHTVMALALHLSGRTPSVRMAEG